MAIPVAIGTAASLSSSVGALGSVLGYSSTKAPPPPATMARGGSIRVSNSVPFGELELGDVIGAGAYKTVHKGVWRGRSGEKVVAVMQVGILPLEPGGRGTCSTQPPPLIPPPLIAGTGRDLFYGSGSYGKPRG